MADQRYSNTLEGGTDGTAITGANSGGASGTAFGSVQGTWTYKTTSPLAGSVSAELAIDATSRYLRCDDPSPSGRGGISFKFKYDGTAPSATAFLAGLRDASDALHGSAVVNTAGKIGWANSAGTVQPASLSASALSTGIYRVDVMLTPATTSTLTVELNVYNSSNVSVLSWNSGAAQTSASTNPVGRVRAGTVTSTSGWTTLRLDNLVWGHVASGEMGDVANTAPTGTITANQWASASSAVSATVTMTDAESPGSLTYSWTGTRYSASAEPASITITSGAATVTANWTCGPAGTVDIMTCVVSDGALTTNMTTEVRVALAGSTSLRPLRMSGSGGFTNVGGTSTTGGALQDESNSTYLQTASALSASEQVQDQRLQPAYPRSDMTTIHTLWVDTAAATATANVRLKEGSTGTVRQTWTRSVTDTATSYTFTIDSSTVATIVDTGYLLASVGFTS